MKRLGTYLIIWCVYRICSYSNNKISMEHYYQIRKNSLSLKEIIFIAIPCVKFLTWSFAFIEPLIQYFPSVKCQVSRNLTSKLIYDVRSSRSVILTHLNPSSLLCSTIYGIYKALENGVAQRQTLVL